MTWPKMRLLKTTVHGLLAAIPLYSGILLTPAYGRSYSTNFPKAEPLISEGGHWITAGTPGVNWHDTMAGFKGDQQISGVSTTRGYAFGPTGPSHFGDALALLTGKWSPDQMAEATVRQVKPFGYPEVEIRLRTSPVDATGYEIMWSALGNEGKPYLAIATWNGPLSAPPHWTFLKELHGPDYGVKTGDVVKATIVGNIISAYKNGKLQFQITDNTFSRGNPGFGFNEGPNGKYGISSFKASEIESGATAYLSSYTPSFLEAGSLVTRLISSAKWIEQEGHRPTLNSFSKACYTCGSRRGETETRIRAGKPKCGSFYTSASLSFRNWRPLNTG